tara:strand:- start:288 stop:821 length:534 start_codon:yes stop_codon:yes gene_type:complete
MSSFSNNKSKFFTILWFIVFSISSSAVSAQVLVRNSETGKTIEIPFGSTLYYQLHSDSILSVKLPKEEGVLQTTGDSTFVFMDQSEIVVNDISYLEIRSKKIRKWRAVMAPFLVGGSGALIRGLVMLIGEGSESHNKHIIPLYTGIGGVAVLGSSIPFLMKNKSFDLNNSKWELVIP